MMDLPTFDTYGKYSSSNYGANCIVFQTAKGRFWFSYQTMVAFKVFDGTGDFYIRENAWGPTTGKHLNWIDRDKAKRINTVLFEEAFTNRFPEEVVV